MGHARQRLRNHFSDFIVELRGINPDGGVLPGAGFERIHQGSTVLRAKLLLVVRVGATTLWTLLHLLVSELRICPGTRFGKLGLQRRIVWIELQSTCVGTHRIFRTSGLHITVADSRKAEGAG